MKRVLLFLGAVLLVAALTLPDDYGRLGWTVFVRLPVEALVLALAVWLPGRFRSWVAGILGGLIGLLAVLKIVDIGFSAVLARPFDLVLDWGLLGDATGVVEDSVGQAGAVGAVIGLILLIGLIVGLTTLAAIRLTRLAAGHRTVTLRAVAVLAVVWVAAAIVGLPLAAGTDANLVRDQAVAIHSGLLDKRAYDAEAAVDPFRDTPDLLSGLRGKDVVVVFVESYGKSAVTDPSMSGPIDAVLDDGTAALTKAGFGTRSAYLTSSTVGGGSWLAHSTLLSGLEIDNQQRYRTLTSGDRLTLPSAFRRSGWDTVSVEPAIDRTWPEGRFFGYSTTYDSRNLGYRGPRLSYATMPDQYTFATFQRLARGPGHRPLFAEITLVSSHSPWTPLPRMVPWSAVGDGSIYHQEQVGGPASGILGNPSALKTGYRDSIVYSLSALISYVQNYGDPDLVLLFLGDHQPAPVITGPDAGRDVPVTLVTKDPGVLARTGPWGWTPGLRPGPDSPTWPMRDLRNTFLATFTATQGRHS